MNSFTVMHSFATFKSTLASHFLIDILLLRIDIEVMNASYIMKFSLILKKYKVLKFKVGDKD